MLLDAQALDGVGEIEIDAQAVFADAAAFVADGFGVARSDVARNQIAEAGIAALQIIIALGFGNLGWAGACRPFASGTQMRPSLRSDSLISVSLD